MNCFSLYGHGELNVEKPSGSPVPGSVLTVCGFGITHWPLGNFRLNSAEACGLTLDAVTARPRMSTPPKAVVGPTAAASAAAERSSVRSGRTALLEQL